MEDKIKKQKGKQIENNNKYGSYKSNYINNPFKLQDLNAPIKRHWQSGSNTRFNYVSSTRNHFKYKGLYRLKVTRWLKIC